MAAGKTGNRAELKNLLDGMVKSQKKDIHDFSGGHLNEANLYKHSKFKPSSTWASSNKPSVKLNKPSKIPRPPKQGVTKQEEMEKAIADFSLGTVVENKKTMRRPPKDTKRPVVLDKIDRENTIQSQGSYKTDGIFVEELRLPEVLVQKRGNRDPGSIAWLEDNVKLDEPIQMPPTQSQIKEKNLKWMQQQFVPSHLDSVTKKDQYDKMKNFESTVIRKQDTMETSVLTGTSAVEHLETRLRQDLDTLQYNGYGPNFHRLQIYSNTFDNLILESPTFCFVLKTIKKEYDDYIAHLLDGQQAKHQVLYDQVEQLSTRATYDPKQLPNETHRVEGLEKEGKVLLEYNERLRRELEEEMELAALPDPEPIKKRPVLREEAPMELVDQVEELHATILEKLDQMNSLKTKLRKEYVPSSVCTHLEQCIKETEVDIQKLTQQQEYFERSIKEMERELQEAIESADTTDRDARRVWKRIEAVKQEIKGSALLYIFDSDEEDDEIKWNWYIS